MDRKIFAYGAISAFIAVALGAFGAHALKDQISPAMLEVFRTGVSYHLAHSLALLICAFSIPILGKRAKISAILFLIGIIIFGGSLYALSITGIRSFGMITPLGGVAFLAGWAILAYAALNHSEEKVS